MPHYDKEKMDGCMKEHMEAGHSEAESREMCRKKMEAQEKAEAPFAGFKDFDACVQYQVGKGRSKESAQAICGEIKKRAEGQHAAGIALLNNLNKDEEEE